MDEGTRLNGQTQDCIELRECRRRFRNVEEDEDTYEHGCGLDECGDRVHIAVEYPLYDKET